jgi:glutamate synthase domain-containing protein 2/glutamate synthase domain-containing protein 1/glutamate synthase domain-containing protein 3
MLTAPKAQGLYDPQFEHDACGVGFIAHVKGQKSHAIIRDAIRALNNLNHRGACGCEANTGDGAGILLQTPHEFLAKAAKEAKFSLPSAKEYGVGMIFLPQDAKQRAECEKIFEQIVAEEGQTFLGWRTVPTVNTSLGNTAKASEPVVRQAFIGRSAKLADDMAFERKLYVIRKRAENTIRYGRTGKNVAGGEHFYVCSLSYKTLIYKGMLMPEQVTLYFPDLLDESMQTAIALVHSRFSTNTFPSWPRAHPNRYLAHNGEINTLRGNVNWMNARQMLFESDVWGDDIKKLLPIANTDGSDSAVFDNCLELLALSGRSLPHAMMMMIPEPWENHESMSDEKRAFYQFHSALMEPWDGPASMAFTDGLVIGASLDRNGLRPSRYYVTKDDLVIMASEVGVVDIAPERVAQKGRLQPGRMFLIDTEQGRIVADEELKNTIATQQPYRLWLNENLVEFDKLADPPHIHEPDHETVMQRELAFGYSFEDCRKLILPMARDGVEPVGSMGTDTPLAVLSDKTQLLYNYFKQLFAQVTNPPIDCIREEIITSAFTLVGSEGNLLKPTPQSAHMIQLKSPILDNEQLEKLRHVVESGFKAVTLPILFQPGDNGTNTAHGNGSGLPLPSTGRGNEGEGWSGPASSQGQSASNVPTPHPGPLPVEGRGSARGVSSASTQAGRALEAALENLFQKASEAIKQGTNIIVLSDRGVDANNAPIPALLAVAGLHHHLIREGTRTRVGIVLESAEPREVHHFSLLIGYGCTAINPYLAFEAIDDLIHEGLLGDLDHKKACKNYIKAAVKGVIKTMSKMGISTIQSYRGAQIFEAIGLNRDVVAKYFTGTASQVEGVGIDVLAQEAQARHRAGFPLRGKHDEALEPGGQYQWRANGEYHLFNPESIHKLQLSARTNNYKVFLEYAQEINDQLKHLCTLRGMFELKYAAQPIPIDEVESAESIMKRFKSGAMSYGSISKEAHETLAIAMNRIGGRSNTGEGGEDPNRYFNNKGSSPFQLGQHYSRDEIAARVGGGSTIEYLPEVNGRIVAACLRPDINPNAPDVILPGIGGPERTAQILCEQRNIIPVFIRRAANQWEYVGDYEVRDYSTDSQVIAEHEALPNRSREHGISRVIYMQRRNYDDSKNSAIKQVASGRFGVTSNYLIHAKELQIKMAQGAKPGEGGQLPGKKVYPWIAKVRHSTPGVGLISPPPHHDIYSIEDLAELIHDLKNANSDARINVKLVSEIGVGTIAAGVAKGHADVILISGYDGGTGASPLSSIKHAGTPWELGLAETHQTLVLNNLRSRVYVETDGQLKTGRDIAVAALLGAEEFGFATAPLVVMGCIMMRVCHADTCPVGVATQNPELRKKFAGNPDHVVNFFKMLTQNLREEMAKLGFRTINEMVGRTDMLDINKAIAHYKAKGLDFSRMFYQPQVGPEVGRYRMQEQDHGLEQSLDRTKLFDICKPALERGEKVRAELPIRNVHRVVCTQVGSALTRKHGPDGLPDDTIHLKFNGSAGQSFGAFVPRGVTLELEGDANDYIGKGLSGGKIIVYPPKGSTFVAEDNIIVGNVGLYGATSGEIYIRGMAGERFAVRNSGVRAVVEAVGDHGCEYMTGGRVVVLGATGRNFAAGMSGGVAYVLDVTGDFPSRCNKEMVELSQLTDALEIAEVRGMIDRHARFTHSDRAKKILDLWDDMLPKFVKVLPKDYKRMLECIDRAQKSGFTGEEAIMKAFQENANDVARVGGN